jgi:hypothetical protein
MLVAGSSLFRLGVALFLLALLGCNPGSKPADPPAEKPHVEADLARTTLSERAATSLDIHSEPLRPTSVRQYLPLPGWLAVKQGNEVTLTAPVAGYVRAPTSKKGRLPIAGLPVHKEDELFRIEPVLSPLEQIQLASLKRSVRNEMNKAVESVKMAQLEFERVRGLKEQGLRQKQDLEQADARLKHAQEDEAAARFKLELFGKEEQGGPARPHPVPIIAPQTGQALQVAVTPGQYVPASALLVSIADMSELWARVPVPETDLPRIALDQPAELGPRPSGSGASKEVAPALPPLSFIALVPQVDRTRHTADLIYRLPKEARKVGLIAKDQLVNVQVPLGEKRDEFVVPYDAVVFDSHDGAWVYFDQSPTEAKMRTYERRRVEVGPTLPSAGGGYNVVLRRLDAKQGERIVTRGAAKLFSREFYKPPTPAGQKAGEVDDDD